MHKAVRCYLRAHPVTLRDVELLVPDFNVYPFRLMYDLASNIGYYHHRRVISETELQEIYA